MNKKITFLVSLILLLASSLFAQNSDDVSAENTLDASSFSGSVQEAMSNADYMVTAGDVYSLTYAANGTAVSYTIAVDSSYRMRVSNLAVLDVSGKSYLTVKKQVEEIVQKNYPLSGVQFVLLNPATYKVTVKGEVTRTTERSIWALTRLSSVVSGITTPYSSVRDITVTSANGKKRVYDLFKAQRNGDLSQNPYLRPGDVITINRILRKVTISGSVERPGTYELMKGENLKELIEYYGNGLTELADTTRITLVRSRDSKNKSGDQIYLDENAITKNYELKNGDVITIYSNEDLRPSIIVEGIINNPKPNVDNITNTITEESKSAIDASYRTSVKFYDGENYATLIRRISGMFSTYSDLQNSYVVRNGEKVPMNLEDILYDAAFVSEYNVQKDDKLVIPFQQNFQKVIVKGEVTTVREENAWPLRRLSTIIADNLTNYSSTRNVQVTSVDGKTTTYDLFRASRFGDLEQNPYIRSGETITIQRMDRKVTISGSVERPGTYELMKGENLKELIEYYGNGLTELADTRRIELTRSLETKEGYESGEKIYLNQDDFNANYPLECFDVITVYSYKSLKPVMFVEGAIQVNEGVSLESSTRKIIQFENGTDYAYLIRNHLSLFNSAVADTKNAYIVRGEQNIPLNLDSILYDSSYSTQILVQSNDTLIVPFRQYFVTVAGSVNAPGRFPYIPDRTADYYIGLAGGFDKTQNFGDAMNIVDINGKKLKSTDIITPETTITAKANSFTYYFTRYSGFVTVLASLITTTISVMTVINSK